MLRGVLLQVFETNLENFTLATTRLEQEITQGIERGGETSRRLVLSV